MHTNGTLSYALEIRFFVYVELIANDVKTCNHKVSYSKINECYVFLLSKNPSMCKHLSINGKIIKLRHMFYQRTLSITATQTSDIYSYTISAKHFVNFIIYDISNPQTKYWTKICCSYLIELHSS